MMCHFSDIRCKEVISIKSGCRIGFVDDVEIDSCTAKICRIIVYGKSRCFGIFGREEDIFINWSDIEIIGEDTILVGCDFRISQNEKAVCSKICLNSTIKIFSPNIDLKLLL